MSKEGGGCVDADVWRAYLWFLTARSSGLFAAAGKLCRLFAAHGAHRPPDCLVASLRQGGRRSERRLNNFFCSIVTLHKCCLSSFPAHLKD